MNFITSLIHLNSDSLPISDRIEAKKHVFGVGDELEIHKLIYGLFLDGFKPEACEETDYGNLSKYEFFAGSLTWNRVCKELEAFLVSDFCRHLCYETQKQLQEFIGLLKESHELNQHIDFYRSSELRLIFLTATGMGMSAANNAVELAPEKLKSLTSLALQKVGSLEVGEKAIFLTGTILHETLLYVERVDQKNFKLNYYDSARSVSFHMASDEILLQETFWNTLYSLKFSAHLPETFKKIRAHFNALQMQKKEERDKHSLLPAQKKNTCHFRCLLAYLKDQVVGKSILPLQSAYLEWNHFKTAFGQFLLQSEHLQNEELAKLSQKKQEKRSKKSDRAIALSSCIAKESVTETLELYHALLMECGFHLGGDKPWRYFHSGNPLKDLIRAEKTLIETLMSYPISPEDLELLTGGITNPWVLESLALFKDQWMQRREKFQEALSEELAASECPIGENFKYYGYEILQGASNFIFNCARTLNLPGSPIQWNSNPEVVPGASLHENEVQDLLDLFEENIQRLQFLEQKPCCLTVLIQAIQLGKIEQVERIYKGLSKEDQRRLLVFCSIRDSVFFPQTLPKNMKDYILQQEDSPFAPILAIYCCQQAWLDGEIAECLKIAQAVTPARGLSIFLADSIRSASGEGILNILSGLESFSKEQTKSFTLPYSETILLMIEQSLLKLGDTDLIKQAFNYAVPGLERILDVCLLGVLYKKGQFEQIQDLGLHEKEMTKEWVLRDMHFCFNLENFQEGLEIFKSIVHPNFGTNLRDDLLTFACQINAKDSVLNLLDCYANSPCYREDYLETTWGSLGHEKLLFILETVLEASQQKENPFVLSLIRGLLQSTKSKKAFLQTCKACESVQPELIHSLMEDPCCDELYQYIDASNTSLLAEQLGKKLSSFYLPFLKWSIPNSVEDPSNEKYLQRFLVGWNFLSMDFDLNDQKGLYENFIKPLFQTEANNVQSNGVEVVLAILKEIPQAEDFRALIALVWLEAGHRAEALRICPDGLRLDEVGMGLSSK